MFALLAPKWRLNLKSLNNNTRRRVINYHKLALGFAAVFFLRLSVWRLRETQLRMWPDTHTHTHSTAHNPHSTVIINERRIVYIICMCITSYQLSGAINDPHSVLMLYYIHIWTTKYIVNKSSQHTSGQLAAARLSDCQRTTVIWKCVEI